MSQAVVQEGVCYYCGWECNPSSQACGACMREASMYGAGMKTAVPDYIKGGESFPSGSGPEKTKAKD